MLGSIIWILLGGFFAGRIAAKLGAPALLGMVLAGIVLGPQVADRIGSEVLSAADGLRTIAVMIILMKAGLGLDREKLAKQGTVALRLGLLPASCEAIAVALTAMWLFQFDLFTGLLLGCVVGAESPAVIVPGMLRLKRLGWGVKKGIPDAILLGSALSDVLLLLMFSLLLSFLSSGMASEAFLPGGTTLSPLQLLPLQVIVQVALGVALGWASARLLVALLAKGQWTKNRSQETLVAASCALLLVVVATHVPIFSGYLAVMAAGFFIIELDMPLARRLREGFNSLWIVAEIILFVLLGTSIQIGMLETILLPGLLLLAIGTLVGRAFGWYLATLGSDWTAKERLFLLPGNSAKATVQAAIGAIPLAQGVAGGEVILAIAALSILVTAPLGAWAIPTFAFRLLQKGTVDPTKVAVVHMPILLAAVDASPCSVAVLTKAAELARSRDGEVIALYVHHQGNSTVMPGLQERVRQLLADVPHQFIIQPGDPVGMIVQTAQTHGVDEIVIGKRRDRTSGQNRLGLVAHAVIEASPQPVMVVES